MWKLDHKEGGALKNWFFWTVVLEKTLKSPLDHMEIKPVNIKGNQLWIFIGRTDAEAPILWPLDAKRQLIRKDPDSGKDWGQEEKGMTGWDNCMASLTQLMWVWASSRRWWRTWKPGVLQSMGSQRIRYNWVTNSCLESHGWRSLVGCSPWGRKESDTTERQDWTELILLHWDCSTQSFYQILFLSMKFVHFLFFHFDCSDISCTLWWNIRFTIC